MDEQLDKIINEIKIQKFKEKEKIISLYKNAFKIINDDYDVKKEQSLESSKRIKKILNRLGKVNTIVVDFFGGYICSHEKKISVENEILEFIYQSLGTQDISNIGNEHVVNTTVDVEYEKKYYEALDKIDSLKAEIREKNKIVEEQKKQRIKVFQKILGIIGSVPKTNSDEKIVHLINDFLEDDEIHILWSANSEEESNLFDILKTTLEIENEVVLPALISEKVVVEKGLIYRKEK